METSSDETEQLKQEFNQFNKFLTTGQRNETLFENSRANISRFGIFLSTIDLSHVDESDRRALASAVQKGYERFVNYLGTYRGNPSKSSEIAIFLAQLKSIKNRLESDHANFKEDIKTATDLAKFQSGQVSSSSRELGRIEVANQPAEISRALKFFKLEQENNKSLIATLNVTLKMYKSLETHHSEIREDVQKLEAALQSLEEALKPYDTTATRLSKPKNTGLRPPA